MGIAGLGLRFHDGVHACFSHIKDGLFQIWLATRIWMV
jgi:hypothetical protein